MPKQIFVKALPMLLGLACLGPLLFVSKSALAANPTTINFQGKVVNSDGTNVSNGPYSFIFRLYDSSSGGNISTNCSDNSHCWWEETQSSVQVTNGVFQVELGSICSFASACNSTHSGISWNSNNALYLTLQFNGDTSGSYHGFMTPLIHLNTVPYAFNADQLGGISSSGFIQNTVSAQTSNFYVQSASSGDIAGIVQGASGQSVDIFDVLAYGNSTPLLGVNSNGFLSLQPAANLISGQTAISQTLTNASSSGGTVKGYGQTITVNNTSSASTTVGTYITVTDSTTGSLTNFNNGLTVLVNGTNASQEQVGIDSLANHGVGIRGQSTGTSGSNVSCGGYNTGDTSIGICGSTAIASSSAYGGYFVANGNGATALYATNVSTTATLLQLQANNVNALVVNSSGNVMLGQSNTGGLNGTIVFNTSAGTGTATITLAGNPSTNYTYQLPTGTVGSNQCLQSGSVSSGTVPLLFATCSTLASAYNISGTSGNTIGLTQNGGGVIIQDASTPLTPTGTNLFAVQKNGGTVTYLGVSATGIDIQSNYTGSAVTALVFDTSAATPHLKIYGSNGTSYADIYYNTSTSTAYYGASAGTAVLGNGTGNVSVNAGSGYGFTITGHAASSISTDSGILSLDGLGGLNLGTSTATILIGQTSGGSTQVQSANGLIIGTASLAGQLAIYNGSNSVTIKAGSSTAAYNLILPASAGTNNYCLVNTSTPGTLQWLPCGAGNTAKVVLTPEFIGAVMTPVSLTGWTNSGTMTSDFCSGSSLLNVAPSPNPCAASDQHSYYAWTASSNCVNYDIWVNWSVPNDFSSFPSSNNNFNAWKTGNSTSCNSVSGNDDVKVNVYTAGATSTCATQSMTNTSGSWQNTAINMSGCSPSAGSILTFDIQLKVNTSGDYVRMGEITLDYNRM